MKTATSILALCATAILVAACGGSDKDGAAKGTANPGSGAANVRTLPRPATLAAMPLVDLLAPGELNVGRAPTFEWAAVAGASEYRLSVLGPAGPQWGWQGSETSVRYGGVPEGVGGPSLAAGSWWSVGAFGTDGSLVALSDLRAVSPGGDRGPAPAWAAGAPAASTPAPAATASTPTGARACDLLTSDEIHAAIKGTWGEPALEVYPSGQNSRCDWTSEHGTHFSVSIMPASTFDPAGWAADGTVDDLGDESFFVHHGLDRQIAFRHGEFSVSLVITFLKVDMDGLAGLARIAESRLP